METLRSTFTEKHDKLFLNKRGKLFCVETLFTSIYSSKDLERAIARFEREAA